MCLAMNPDKVPPGERCASTSNRNFVGRQGPGARTHLALAGDGRGGGGDGPAGRRARAGRMKAVTAVEGRAYPLGRANVDTDIIIPAEHLKTIARDGLGRFAFETIRAEPGNVFDDPAHAGAPILIAGDNFGCGSSREHAVWAMLDLGIRAVIAPSFSDIFASNAFKNGLVAVALPQAAVDRLMAVASDQPIRIDLETMTRDHPLSGPVRLRARSVPPRLPDARPRRDRADAGKRGCDRRL